MTQQIDGQVGSRAIFHRIQRPKSDPRRIIIAALPGCGYAGFVPQIRQFTVQRRLAMPFPAAVAISTIWANAHDV
jgi:hypothetical protein